MMTFVVAVVVPPRSMFDIVLIFVLYMPFHPPFHLGALVMLVPMVVVGRYRYYSVEHNNS